MAVSRAASVHQAAGRKTCLISLGISSGSDAASAEGRVLMNPENDAPEAATSGATNSSNEHGQCDTPPTNGQAKPAAENEASHATSPNSPISPGPSLPLEAVIFPPNSLIELYHAHCCATLESADCYIVGAFLPVISSVLGRNVSFPWG